MGVTDAGGVVEAGALVGVEEVAAGEAATDPEDEAGKAVEGVGVAVEGVAVEDGLVEVVEGGFWLEAGTEELALAGKISCFRRKISGTLAGAFASSAARRLAVATKASNLTLSKATPCSLVLRYCCF